MCIGNSHMQLRHITASTCTNISTCISTTEISIYLSLLLCVCVCSEEKSTSASIFGGAKPVDTAAKEREIEERAAKERENAAKEKEMQEKVMNSRVCFSSRWYFVHGPIFHTDSS